MTVGNKPYPHVSIIIGDCRRVLPCLPLNSFSALVTSPPYWNVRSYGGGDGEVGRTPTASAWLDEISACMAATRPLLDPEAVAWLNLGDRFAPDGSIMLLPYRAGIRLQDDGWFLRTDIVWHRPNALPEPVRKRPVRCHEALLMLAHNSGHRYDPAAVREPATMKPQRRLTRRTAAGQPSTPAHRVGSQYVRAQSGLDSPDGLRHLRSVWSIATEPGRWGHPAPFPLALADICLRASACPLGSHVLDPFGGSGTTALAAWKLGLGCTLVELDAGYAVRARDRLLAEGVPNEHITVG